MVLRFSDEASGEPPLKRIKTEENENELYIEQDVEEETYEEQPEEEIYEHELTLKDEPQ